MPTVTGTTGEQLTFLHRDAANVTLRSTNAAGILTYESGEYDAMGRNVVDAGPYVTLNTEPPSNENGGGIDLGGTGEGYRPGRSQFSMDGMAVPESYYMMKLNSGRIGGAFGLLETAARLSAPTAPRLLDLSVGNLKFSLTDDGADRAINEALESGNPILINWAVTYSWSFNVLLLSKNGFPYGNNGENDGQTMAKELPKNLRESVAFLAKKPNCIDVIQELFMRLKKLGKGDYYSLDLMKNFDRVNTFTFKGKNDGTNVGVGASSAVNDELGRFIKYSKLTTPNETLRLVQYSHNTIAELLHLGRKDSWYSDADLDAAVKDMLTKEEWQRRVADQKAKKINGKGFIAHSFVEEFCNYTQEEMDSGKLGR